MFESINFIKHHYGCFVIAFNISQRLVYRFNMVFNKIDAFKHLTIDEDDLITEKTRKHYTLEEWKTTWMNNVGKEKAIFISATNKENFEEFRERVYEAVREIHISRFPYNKFLYPDFKDAIEKEEE